MTQTETKKNPDPKANGPKGQEMTKSGASEAPSAGRGSKGASLSEVHPEDENKALAVYDPKAEEGWQILDTGEGRLYWYRDNDADPKDKRANTIMGFASDVDSFMQENMKSGELEERHFIKVQTTAPCWTVGADKDERGRAIPMIAPKGSLVWVGVTHALQGLHRKVNSSPVVLEVQLKGVAQVPIGGGQTVWRIAQAVRATKKRRLVEVPQAPRDGGESEIPF